MKSFLKYLYDVVESIGRAKAASHLARMGNYEAAKRVMVE